MPTRTLRTAVGYGPGSPDWQSRNGVALPGQSNADCLPWRHGLG